MLSLNIKIKMLTVLFLSLLIVILSLLMIDKKQELLIKKVSLAGSLLVFIESVLIWIIYDNSNSEFQFIINYNVFNYLTINFGIDSLNLYYILLTTFLTPIILLSSWENIKQNIKNFYLINLIIEFILIIIFSVIDLMLFYISFEAVLIPLFLIVGYWGGSATKVRATFLLFMYTLAGSLLILLAIVKIFNNYGTLNFNVLKNIYISEDIQLMLFFCFFISFSIKTPLMPFHMWLPRAHSEAPLAGSIVLAGTVLKTATYGFIRIVIPYMPYAINYYLPFIQTILITTLIYSSLATIRQSDTKALIAYSSIAHMSVMMLGLYSNNIQGIEGSVLLSIAHGFVSPALFMIVGGVLYDRYHTRIIKEYRGLYINIPLLTTIFFLFTCANIGVPLSINWLGEFMSLNGAFNQNMLVGALGSFSIILSSCYGIWLWSRMSGGEWSNVLPLSLDMTKREFIILFILLSFTILFGVYPNIILNDLHFNVSSILYSNI